MKKNDYWSRFDNIDQQIDEADLDSEPDEYKPTKKAKFDDSDYEDEENMQDFSDRNYSEEMSNRHEQPKLPTRMGITLPSQMQNTQQRP